jgi:hypothetical protein
VAVGRARQPALDPEGAQAVVPAYGVDALDDRRLEGRLDPERRAGSGRGQREEAGREEQDCEHRAHALSIGSAAVSPLP